MGIKNWKLLCLLVAVSSALIPATAQGSAWLSCEALVRVDGVRTNTAVDGISVYLVKIHLLSDLFSCEGHSIPARYFKGDNLWVQIVSECPTDKMTVGTKLRLKYEAYNGRGPNGLVDTEEWSVLGDSK